MRRAAGIVAGAGGAWAGPAVLSLGPCRRALAAAGVAPRLSGLSSSAHLALTFDDGPDAVSTPLFIEMLAAHRVHATFFVLGRFARTYPEVIADLVGAGHEIAVHGWDHQCVAFKRPDRLRGELDRTLDVLGTITGERPQWYRPPYGVLTTDSLVAAHRVGLETVLWSAWGRDWERHVTPGRIVNTVVRAARAGGTVLLHDTDRTSAPHSWRRTLVASEALLAEWARRGQQVGPLRDHWPPSGGRTRADEHDGEHESSGV